MTVPCPHQATHGATHGGGSRDFIVFGEDWGRHPSSTQHIFKNLRSARRVIWVNSIGLRTPLFNVSDGRRALSKIWSWWTSRSGRENPSELDERMVVLSPLVIPLPAKAWAQLINGHLLQRQLRSAVRRHGVQNPVLWISLPTGLAAVGRADEAYVLYYCGDDFNSLAGVDHAAVSRLENRLVSRSHLVFVASPKLQEKFPPGKTMLLPHGVDYDLFSQPAPRALDLPEGTPIAGFYGTLASWVDVELLTFVAEQLPDWWIVLIGPVAADVSGLERCSNVLLLGAKPHEDLPSYVQHWDVSMLPFRDCPQINACDPLKLREYLASGKPIVSTDFPAVREFGSVVSIAHSAGDFVNHIRASFADCTTKSQRQAFVQGETWQRRAEIIDTALGQLDEALTLRPM